EVLFVLQQDRAEEALDTLIGRLPTLLGHGQTSGLWGTRCRANVIALHSMDGGRARKRKEIFRVGEVRWRGGLCRFCVRTGGEGGGGGGGFGGGGGGGGGGGRGGGGRGGGWARRTGPASRAGPTSTPTPPVKVGDRLTGANGREGARGR